MEGAGRARRSDEGPARGQDMEDCMISVLILDLVDTWGCVVVGEAAMLRLGGFVDGSKPARQVKER